MQQAPQPAPVYLEHPQPVVSGMPPTRRPRLQTAKGATLSDEVERLAEALHGGSPGAADQGSGTEGGEPAAVAHR
eukprot:CAMPEP_0119360662 /NCGR_PEP_ID=MMETSP1334-20130426/8194_1 /TAXON_ID=127549 /ORGANISM="Calcidiscus leptoporus, Strain RCC1130" /LENGTH=74 /DNA_ID=CAMNT_0007375523 /DNA_START=423 /DNA_END=647 /DNA_ORIENTATION=-